jgi:hypothetical protein
MAQPTVKCVVTSRNVTKVDVLYQDHPLSPSLLIPALYSPWILTQWSLYVFLHLFLHVAKPMTG